MDALVCKLKDVISAQYYFAVFALFHVVFAHPVVAHTALPVLGIIIAHSAFTHSWDVSSPEHWHCGEVM